MSLTRRAFWRWTVGAGCALGLATSAAAEPAHLAEMPSVERVQAEVRGVSSIDTLALQAATFDALQQILWVRSEKPGAFADPTQFSAGEFAWVERYGAASQAIYATPGIDSTELQGAGMRYMATPRFQDQVVERFFSPAWQADYAAAHARFMAAYAGRSGTAPGESPPLGPPIGEDEGGFLDRPFFGWDGERLTLRDVARGSVKTLGAITIAVLLVLRIFRARRSEGAGA